MTALASAEQLRQVVQAALLVPSVHNTQPWRFVERPDGLELHADPARRLAVLDPDGRQQHLSCGAALFHARAAAREATLLHEVSRQDDLVELEVLLSRADADEQRDEGYRHELHDWVGTDVAASDGIPVLSLDTAIGSSVRQRDFTLTHSAAVDGSAPAPEHPEILVLATDSDTRESWLCAGQALAAVLLRAADHGVQAQPLGQVTDALSYRLRLGAALGMVGRPQLVLRIGYATSVAGATGTPRRAVDDVLSTVRR